MPRYNSFGGASATAFRRKFLPQVAFRSATITANFGWNTAINKPAGIQVGDIVLLVFFITSGGNVTAVSTNGGNPWTQKSVYVDGGGLEYSVWAKVMDAADIANQWFPGVFPNGGFYCAALAYIPKGAVDVTVGAWVENTVTATMTIPGMSNSNSRGAVSGYIDNGGVTGTLPGAFSLTYNPAVAGGAQKFAEQFTGGYNGGPVLWTGVPTTRSTFGFLAKFI